MVKDSFRRVFFPYCLQRQPDGRYAVLNRNYKPVGLPVPSADHVDYAETGCLVSVSGLTAARAKKLSWDGKPDLDLIYLYDDGCVPTDSPANWAAYCARLQVLARLEIGS